MATCTYIHVMCSGWSERWLMPLAPPLSLLMLLCPLGCVALLAVIAPLLSFSFHQAGALTPHRTLCDVPRNRPTRASVSKSLKSSTRCLETPSLRGPPLLLFSRFHPPNACLALRMSAALGIACPARPSVAIAFTGTHTSRYQPRGRVVGSKEIPHT